MKVVCGIIATMLLTPLLLLGQVSGQAAVVEAPCKLAMEDSPSLLGLKLGMTPQQVAEVLGRDVDARAVPTKLIVTTTMKSGHVRREERSTSSSIGETEFTYYPRPDSNVGSLYLRFWRNRLYTYALDFEPRDFAWLPDKSEIEVIADKLGLPKEDWRDSRLDCSDFYVKLTRSSLEVRAEVTGSKTAELIEQEATIAFTQETNGPDDKPVLKKDPGAPEYIPVLIPRYKVPIKP